MRPSWTKASSTLRRAGSASACSVRRPGEQLTTGEMEASALPGAHRCRRSARQQPAAQARRHRQPRIPSTSRLPRVRRPELDGSEHPPAPVVDELPDDRPGRRCGGILGVAVHGIAGRHVRQPYARPRPTSWIPSVPEQRAYPPRWRATNCRRPRATITAIGDTSTPGQRGRTVAAHTQRWPHGDAAGGIERPALVPTNTTPRPQSKLAARLLRADGVGGIGWAAGASR